MAALMRQMECFTGCASFHRLVAMIAVGLCLASGGCDDSTDTTGDETYRWHTFYGAWQGEGYLRNVSITEDAAGNIYVSGTADKGFNGPKGQPPLHAYSGGNQEGDLNAFVLKLSADGAYLWHTFYGPNSTTDTAVAVDESGNIYVAGASGGDDWAGPSGENPLWKAQLVDDWLNFFFVLSLDSQGGYLWHVILGSGYDGPSHVGSDRHGNIYVVGDGGPWNGPSGESPLYNYDAESGGAFVLKIGTDGAYRWHSSWGIDKTSLGWGIDKTSLGSIITHDTSGNLYVLGSSGPWDGPGGESPINPSSADSADAFVLSLDPGGAYRWHSFLGTKGSHEIGLCISMEGDGNLRVAGKSMAQNDVETDQCGFFQAEIALDGAPRRQSCFRPEETDCLPAACQYHAGSFYFSGTSGPWNGPNAKNPIHAHGGGDDAVIVAFDAEGAYRWHSFYGSGEDDVADGLVVGDSGSIHLSGISKGSWTGPAGEPPLNPYGGSRDLFALELAVP